MLLCVQRFRAPALPYPRCMVGVCFPNAAGAMKILINRDLLLWWCLSLPGGRSGLLVEGQRCLHRRDIGGHAQGHGCRMVHRRTLGAKAEGDDRLVHAFSCVTRSMSALSVSPLPFASFPISSIFLMVHLSRNRSMCLFSSWRCRRIDLRVSSLQVHRVAALGKRDHRAISSLFHYGPEPYHAHVLHGCLTCL